MPDRRSDPAGVHPPGRPPQADSSAELRHCERHGLVEFHRYRRSPDAYRYKCKRCVGEAVTRRHRKVRAILVAAAGGRCAVCGYDRAIRALQFHHVDAAQKSIEMTMAHGRSLAAYQEEAKKCVLVCANCHVEIESGLIESPPAGAQYPFGQSGVRAA